MADPLSAAAGVAGLVSLGLQTADYLVNFYTAYRSCDADLARTADRLADLLQSLLTVNNVVKTRKWRASEKPILQDFETSIARCKHVIHDLQNEVQKLKTAQDNNLRGSIKVAGRRAAYPFRRSTLEKLNEDVNDFCENLTVALQTLQLKEHKNTQDDIDDLKKIIEKVQAHHLASSVRQWLRASDATINYNDACGKRHARTGQWFVQSATFTTWLQEENSFLWLNGLAGCGKTVLCSTAIQHAFRSQGSKPSSAIAFFFFTFNDKSKNDVSALLRALLLQLSGQVAGLGAELGQLQKLYNNGTAPVPILMEYLHHAAKRSHHIYILVDALDECPGQEPRERVLLAIQSMRQWSIPGLHLLVTSRDLIDIREALDPRMQNAVALQPEDVDQDILQYVSYQVDNDPRLQRWGAYRETMKKTLTKRANGVFRWVECQLGPLRKVPISKYDLDNCLQGLPQSLDETYERMLLGIDTYCQERAQRILKLLCFSPRPLSAKEIIEAIAVDIHDLQGYNQDRLLGSYHDLLRICPGLIQIHEPPSQPDRLFQPSKSSSSSAGRTVTLAHFSVQEYLGSDRIRRGRAKYFAVSSTEAHMQISQTCLLYLSNEDFLRQALTPELVERFCLAKFAAEYWHHHYKQSGISTTLDLDRWVQKLFVTSNTFERWIRLCDADSWKKDVCFDHQRKDHASPIYYAALLGLDNIISSLSSLPQTNIDALGGEYGNALQAAAAGGHEKVVHLLLDAGADINTQGGEYGNVLQAASATGCDNVVRRLIGGGASVNAQGGKFGTALYAASRYGHEAVVQLLIEAGADVALQKEYGGSILQAASENGYEKVVQLLLHAGANVNNQSGWGGNALCVASKGGHDKVVRILLNKGAEVNAHGGNEGRALYLASALGHHEVVQILIEAGVNVDTLEERKFNQRRCDSALYAASEHGHGKVVQALVEAGADVNAQVGYFGNALYAASMIGAESVVKILLDANANVNTHVNYHGDALGIASKNGHKMVVQMLLYAGADTNSQGGYFGDALRAASLGGHEEVVRLLLDAGADVNAQGSKTYSALCTASALGYDKIVGMLLRAGADTNAEGEKGINALCMASEKGYGGIVQMLLDHGAKTGARPKVHYLFPERYVGALYLASENGHAEVVQILLRAGVDVNVEEGSFGNALQAAAYSGYENVVQILLDAGVDVNVQGALYRASVHRHEKVMPVLLDARAETNTQGGLYKKVLQAASQRGRKVAQMLLETAADVAAQGGKHDNALQVAYSFKPSSRHAMAAQGILTLELGGPLQQEPHLEVNPRKTSLLQGVRLEERDRAMHGSYVRVDNDGAAIQETIKII